MKSKLLALILTIVFLLGSLETTCLSTDSNISWSYYIEYKTVRKVSMVTPMGSTSSSSYIVARYDLEVTPDSIRGHYQVLDTDLSMKSRSYTYKCRIKDFKGLRTPGYQEDICNATEEAEVIFLEPGTLTVKYEFVGTDKYKGYPVFKLKTTIHFKGKTYVQDTTATIYYYQGFPTILYTYVKSTAEGTKYAVSSSSTQKIEMLKTNLPKRIQSKVFRIGDYVIVSGSLGEANLIITGKAGSRTLNVTNKGSSGVAYVLIVYEEPAEKYVVSKRESLPSRAIIQIIPPQTSVLIKLFDPLPEDVNVEATVYSKEEPFPYLDAFLFGLGISLAIIGLLALVIKIRLSSIRERIEEKEYILEETMYRKDVEERVEDTSTT